MRWSSSLYRKKINSIVNTFYREQRIAMLHTARCGSGVLGTMLNAHSKIHWGKEIFNEYMNIEKSEDGSAFVEHIIAQNQQQEISRFFGFETKYLPQQHLCDRCINMDLEAYVTLLRTLKYSKFIVLHRKNYLRRAVSVQVGRQTRQWHSKQEATSPVKVTIDVNAFMTGSRRDPLLDLFRCIDENYSRLKKLLSQDDTLFLTYEDDILEDPGVAYKKVCTFLGINDESPGITYRRTNPFSYEEMVINFEEVKATLKDTTYSWMLDD